MIKWIRRMLSGSARKTLHERGYDYAMGEFHAFGIIVKDRLLDEACGDFKTDFDRGMLYAIRDFSSQQNAREAVIDGG